MTYFSNSVHLSFSAPCDYIFIACRCLLSTLSFLLCCLFLLVFPPVMQLLFLSLLRRLHLPWLWQSSLHMQSFGRMCVCVDVSARALYCTSFYCTLSLFRQFYRYWTKTECSSRDWSFQLFFFFFAVTNCARCVFKVLQLFAVNSACCVNYWTDFIKTFRK